MTKSKNLALTEVVTDFLRLYPNIPTRRIARFVTEKHPEYDYEQVRSSIRYYRGANGVNKRQGLATTEFLEQAYDLPIPSTYDSSEFIIPEKKVLVLSDLQIPFHDNRAIGAAVGFALKQPEKMDAILLNGDVLDNYQLSHFARDPRERSLFEEIEDARDFLSMLKEEFDVPIYFKYGNHEERYERYLWTKAEAFAGIPEISLENILHLKEYNCTPIRDKRIARIGHLRIIHGHEYKSAFDPVNPARTYFLKAKATVLGADKHKTSEHSERNIKGELVTCWSIGCLCDLKPKYLPLNNWNHGFGIVENYGEYFRVQNLRIEGDRVY